MVTKALVQLVSCHMGSYVMFFGWIIGVHTHVQPLSSIRFQASNLSAALVSLSEKFQITLLRNVL